ncbi:MAG: exodeoxyribonuclease III [Bdellovibrionales bacterium]
MIIASWNVNSIKARLDHAKRWLAETPVDVVLLQELKAETVNFPTDAFRELGFVHQHVVGEKTYNGVALLSRLPITETIDALPGDDEYGHARFTGGVVAGVRIYNLYAPNGNPVDGPKFPYKLNWLQRLDEFAAAQLRTEQPIVFGGDFNVIPTNADVKSPDAWKDDALFRPESQRAFFTICNKSYADAYRIFHPADTDYTFWDYRAGAFQKNDGVRIDHFLLSPEAVDMARNCWVDSKPRTWDSPSDHAPILLQLAS